MTTPPPTTVLMVARRSDFSAFRIILAGQLIVIVVYRQCLVLVLVFVLVLACLSKLPEASF